MDKVRFGIFGVGGMGPQFGGKKAARAPSAAGGADMNASFKLGR